jgi:hypothetical protein
MITGEAAWLIRAKKLVKRAMQPAITNRVKHDRPRRIEKKLKRNRIIHIFY